MTQTKENKMKNFTSVICKALDNSPSAIVRMVDGKFGVGRITWMGFGNDKLIENVALFDNLTDANAEATTRRIFAETFGIEW